MSVCSFDLDHFKSINDAYGHAAGDDALKQFADICMSQIRGQDFLGRVGGEEFGLMLVEADESEALRVINRILERVREVAIKSDKGVFSVTASAGVARLRESDAVLGDLMVRADNALYEAKGRGRDRAVLGA